MSLLERSLWVLAFAGLLAFAFAHASRASCVWRWDCTSGQCMQVPLCDQALDLPPLAPLELPPLVMPVLHPLPALVTPPLGTTSCAPTYLCSAQGFCRWQTVCL